MLIVADYAQIELRVAADLAPCPALRQVFRDGRDPHRATAATLAGKPEAEISGHERNYFDVKWADWLARALSNDKRPIVLKGARIFFPEERAEQFNEVLRGFWS